MSRRDQMLYLTEEEINFAANPPFPYAVAPLLIGLGTPALFVQPFFFFLVWHTTGTTFSWPHFLLTLLGAAMVTTGIILRRRLKRRLDEIEQRGLQRAIARGHKYVVETPT